MGRTNPGQIQKQLTNSSLHFFFKLIKNKLMVKILSFKALLKSQSIFLLTSGIVNWFMNNPTQLSW